MARTLENDPLAAGHVLRDIVVALRGVDGMLAALDHQEGDVHRREHLPLVQSQQGDIEQAHHRRIGRGHSGHQAFVLTALLVVFEERRHGALNIPLRVEGAVHPALQQGIEVGQCVLIGRVPVQGKVHAVFSHHRLDGHLVVNDALDAPAVVSVEPEILQRIAGPAGPSAQPDVFQVQEMHQVVHVVGKPLVGIAPGRRLGIAVAPQVGEHQAVLLRQGHLLIPVAVGAGAAVDKHDGVLPGAVDLVIDPAVVACEEISHILLLARWCMVTRFL